jgi:hypothetical protein
MNFTTLQRQSRSHICQLARDAAYGHGRIYGRQSQGANYRVVFFEVETSLLVPFQTIRGR